MLTIGAVVLTINAGFNLLLATAILVGVICLGKNPPILCVALGQTEVARLEDKIIAMVKSLATYFNAAVVSFCLISILVIWAGLSHGEKWAFWALFASMGINQILGFVADSFIGNKTLAVNIVLTAIYSLGIAFSWYGLRMN